MWTVGVSDVRSWRGGGGNAGLGEENLYLARVENPYSFDTDPDPDPAF